MKTVYDSLIIKHCVDCGAPMRYRKNIPDAKVHCPTCRQEKTNVTRNANYDYARAMANKLKYKNGFDGDLSTRIGCTMRGPGKKYYIVVTATTLLTYEDRAPVYIEAPERDLLRHIHAAPSVTCADLSRMWGVKI